jgi:hypothetical protein
MSRRRILRGLGGLAIGIPYLPSLDGESRADVPIFPKRFVYVSSSCGEAMSHWFPNSSMFSWQALSGSVREADLAVAAGQGGLSPVLGPDFDGLLSKMIFLRGLDVLEPGLGGHCPSAALNAQRDTSIYVPTLDQVLASSPIVYPSAPAGARSIHTMSKVSGQAETGLSFGYEGPNYSDSGPTATWQRLFGTYVPDDPIAQKRRELEVGVIDAVREDYDAVIQHPRLSQLDRDRFTAHMDLLQDLRQRLLTQGAACAPPGMPLEDPSMDTMEGLDEVTAMNIALVTAGLACDRTRIAVIQLGVGTDYKYDHHSMQHGQLDPAGAEAYKQIHLHYGDQLAALLRSMDDVVEDPTTGATLLDNSVVLYGNEDGASADGHLGGSMPVLLAGGCGGYFKTGRYVDFRPGIQVQDGVEVGLPYYCQFGEYPFGDYRGRLYNSLLLSIMEAMGETPPPEGIGPYVDMWSPPDSYDVEAGKKPLPHLQG